VRLSGGYVISVQPDDARLLQDAAAMTQRLWSQEDVAEYAVILAVVVPARGSHSATHRHEFNEYILRCWKFNHTIVHDSNMGALEKHCPRLSLNVTTVFTVLPAPDERAIYIMHGSWAVMGYRRTARHPISPGDIRTLTTAQRVPLTRTFQAGYGVRPFL
jgi:hypothetical protein